MVYLVLLEQTVSMEKTVIQDLQAHLVYLEPLYVTMYN